MKRSINKAVAAVLDELRELSKPISTNREIAQVGSISDNSDDSIGKIIADPMAKEGKQGVVTVAGDMSLEPDVVESMQFDRSTSVKAETARYIALSRSATIAYSAVRGTPATCMHPAAMARRAALIDLQLAAAA
jgi:chaperonin GroEL (HSP60 family)